MQQTDNMKCDKCELVEFEELYCYKVYEAPQVWCCKDCIPKEMEDVV